MAGSFDALSVGTYAVLSTILRVRTVTTILPVSGVLH